MTARFALERRPAELVYWFEVPRSCEPTLARSADPWAVFGLPIALHARERLWLDRPLDPLLRGNLDRLQKIWVAWYPELALAEIQAPDASARMPSGEVVGCMSGGVDSLFSFLRHRDAPVEGSASAPMDALLSVGGFNVPNDRLDEWMRHAENVAAALRRPLLPVITNLRFGAQPVVTPYSDTRWSDDLAHGAALAAIAHLLGNVRELVIPASRQSSMLVPWGSHPDTDPLMSSSALRVLHDGVEFSRIERVERIARDPEALALLHVCFRRIDGRNCSRCEKCQRTMLILDMVGARDGATSFDWERFGRPALNRIWIRDKVGDRYYASLAAEAQRRGRADLVEAIEASRRYARVKRTALALIDRTPGIAQLWRASAPLRRRAAG